MRDNIHAVAQKKILKIIFFAFLDIISVILATFLALWIRFDFQQIPINYLGIFWWLPLNCIIVLAFFAVFGLHTYVWRYASVFELISIICSCLGAGISIYICGQITNVLVPRSFWFIFTVFLMFFVCGTRYSYRIYQNAKRHSRGKKKTINMMVVGGGEAAHILIDEINRNVKYNDTCIRCIIDDDKQKMGMRIRGIKVVGNCTQIQPMAEKYGIDQIVIAIPSANKETIAKIVAECQKTECEIKTIPSSYLFADKGRTDNIVTYVRPIKYEDFLGRDQIVVNNEEITGNLVGKTILVTGGGGSIGSELCRQIAKANPKLLIILDIYENNAYEIQQELLRDYPELDLRVIIGSVRDFSRLEKVFKEFRIDQVYHAAAHKHVPLMEVSPNEAIKNNCLGTLNTVKLSDKYGVEKFVLVSTDKAVRPTNIMGASKRICEMIIQTYDKMSKTDYVAVRFGNVLGSNGSVVPLFLKQIEAGGPVTVTHKDITRYFMTIPEAVSLILQASVYAEGGEIFVLDMGKPVKIYDLAKQIIKYKGLRPGKDIKIVFTGLRPGEKLYEEVLMEEEGLKETPNKLIHIGKPIHIKETFLKDLDDLIKVSEKNEDDIKERTAVIVNTYKIAKEK